MKTQPKWMKQVMWRRRLRRIITGGIILLIIGLIFGSFFVNYTTEEIVTAKVVSINTRLEIGSSSDEITHASTTYLVSTDKGVFKIQPDGLMASSVFGMLETGKTYRLHVRGIRMEIMKHLPYIIDAEEVQ
jgi:acyl CoA:acetate/3-ketoacid CoA transferase beta subunit